MSRFEPLDPEADGIPMCSMLPLSQAKQFCQDERVLFQNLTIQTLKEKSTGLECHLSTGKHLHLYK